MQRILVATALFGEEFKLIQPNYISKNVTYICITDQDIFNDVWLIQKWNNVINKRKSSRFIKLKINEIFSGFDWYIWQDSNVIFNTDVREIISAVDNIGSFEHSKNRKNIYEELEACVKYHSNEENESLMRKQIDYYIAQGFSSNFPVYETSVLVRKNTKKSKLFCDFWWNQIQMFSNRDQLSIGYSAWKTNMEIYSLSPGNVYDNPYFEISK